jgi:transcriptional regulator with XRE-family HTH domain
MTTTLGKELKKLRIDLGLTLLGMAQAMNMSSSFLSAIETGRKRVPDNFLDTLTLSFGKVQIEKNKYEVLINQARKEVRMSIEDSNFEDAALATALARRFSNLTPEQKKRLLNIVGGD